MYIRAYDLDMKFRVFEELCAAVLAHAEANFDDTVKGQTWTGLTICGFYVSLSYVN